MILPTPQFKRALTLCLRDQCEFSLPFHQLKNLGQQTGRR
jgi:hypothetical protein